MDGSKTLTGFFKQQETKDEEIELPKIDTIEGYSVDEKDVSVINKLGYIPSSVWYIKSKSAGLQMFARDNMGVGTFLKKERNKDGEEKEIYGKGLSQFHPDVAKRIIEYWSEPGDIILDPFAGRARALIAKVTGRSYHGYEISPTAYKDLMKRLNVQNTFSGDKTEVTVFNKNSGTIADEEKYDMIFSCPPYWIVEDYDKLYGEKVEGQLSSIKSYEEFMSSMHMIIINCYKALKKGKYAVFVVNDFRHNGKLVLFHKDVIQSFLDAGFDAYDIVINKTKTNVPIKIKNHYEKRYMIKEHEYVLVFKK